MRLFGLIGYPLSHSFSKRYFTEKFQKENIEDAHFENFEIPAIQDFPSIIKNNPAIRGLNVTIPYKQEVIPFLTRLDKSAEFVGAVNVIKPLPTGELVGFNSDYYGFMESLKRFLPAGYSGLKALILGTGGAAKAVEGALKTLGISYRYVSRQGKDGALTYEEVDKVIADHKVIINTTPLGMYPKIENCPEIPYEKLSPNHYLFDLVYNPEVTLFMKKGLEKGAKAKNGLEMLYLQAEKAWEIWNG